MVEHSGEKVVETAREARGGYLDRPVLLVLVVSTVLAGALMAFLWIAKVF